MDREELKAVMNELPAKARELVIALEMELIPHEGAWFAPAFRSERAADVSDSSGRVAFSGIYTLLTEKHFSALHRLSIDEVWYYQAGSPVELLLLHADGRGERKRLGTDVARGEQPQCLVSARTWMGARCLEEGKEAYSLVGNCVIPSFSYDDYEAGDRNRLLSRYPEFKDDIIRLTR